MYNILNDRSRLETFRDIFKEEAFDKDHYVCDVGISGMCAPTEICVPKHINSRTGKDLCS